MINDPPFVRRRLFISARFNGFFRQHILRVVPSRILLQVFELHGIGATAALPSVGQDLDLQTVRGPAVTSRISQNEAESDSRLLAEFCKF